MPGKTQESPYTVSSLTMELKSVIERGYTRIYVEGEISGWRPYPSGHVYFTLKDGGAQIQSVMFKSSFERCRARASLRDGAKVLVYANATIYPQRGNYQLVVLAAKPVGEGDLMQRYLMLKAKLEAEGLFSQERKRPLPFMPRRIAIVTSPAGAVVHDMCRVLMRRFPALEIRIFPAQVQGADAPRAVIAGLDYFNGLAAGGSDFVPDVIIVARGGGSFEDLFCFSDEALVRAVAASRVPVISAVGHETDFTLCDFAADVRAGTPSIAAEIAVPEMSELRRRLERLRASLASAVRGKYEWLAQRLDHLQDSLSAALRESLSDAGSTLRLLSEKLALLSPYAVLERGYSLTTDASGRVVKCAADAPVGAKVTTRLASGVLESVVSSSISQDAPPGGADKNAKEGRDG